MNSESSEGLALGIRDWEAIRLRISSFDFRILTPIGVLKAIITRRSLGTIPQRQTIGITLNVCEIRADDGGRDSLAGRG